MDPFAPQTQSIVIALLVAAWSAMAVLARRSMAKPVRPQVMRVSLTLTAALTGALLACIVWSRPQQVRSDLAPIWASARALVQHQDPYEAVGPGRAYDTVFPQIYPMTSIVTVAPLAVVPLRWADVLFVGLGFGLFTWAATRRRLMTPSLVALVSLPALMTLQTIGGSDYFGPVHWMTSADLGKTWTKPEPVPALGRVPQENGSEEGVCDVVPDWHPQSRSVLALGWPGSPRRPQSSCG